MKLAFATLGCPAWTMEQIAANAARMGYDGVELRGVAGEHIGPDEPPERRDAIRKLFDDAGVQILSIMGYSRFTLEDAAQQRNDIDVACQFLDTAKSLGCPTLRVFGGGLPASGRDAVLQRVIEGLKRVTDKAERVGVKVAIETHDDWCGGENLAKVLAGVNSPALGVCWDVANSFIVEPPETTFAAIQGHIAHVHFKDIRPTPDGKHSSALPGTGVVPLEKILGILHRAGYKGVLSFEWEKKWEPALQEPEIALPHYLRFTTGLMKKLGVPRG